MTRFKPFPTVSCQYGAPMGRQSANLQFDPEHDTTDSLACAGPAYEYDAGGAYWGHGGSEGPVWAVWRKGLSSEGVTYVRAFSREQAKRKALESAT